MGFRYNPYLLIYVCYRCICKKFQIKICLNQLTLVCRLMRLSSNRRLGRGHNSSRIKTSHHSNKLVISLPRSPLKQQAYITERKHQPYTMTKGI